MGKEYLPPRSFLQIFSSFKSEYVSRKKHKLDFLSLRYEKMLLLLLFPNTPNTKRYYVISYFSYMQKTYDKLVKVKIGRIDIGAQSVEAYSVIQMVVYQTTKRVKGHFMLNLGCHFCYRFA